MSRRNDRALREIGKENRTKPVKHVEGNQYDGDNDPDTTKGHQVTGQYVFDMSHISMRLGLSGIKIRQYGFRHAYFFIAHDSAV